MKISFIAGNNADYVFSLVQKLTDLGVDVELLGSPEYDNPAYSSRVTFIPVRTERNGRARLWTKMWGILSYYYKCFSHLSKSDSRLVHIQSFRFEFLEGILLTFAYQVLGKQVIYTAHNVKPKGTNNVVNRLIYKWAYKNLDHLICHTEDIKRRLIARYRLSPNKITVVQRGVNQITPTSDMSRDTARRRLGLDQHAKVLLLFGRIRTEKGHLVALEALEQLAASHPPMTLIIAGEAVKPSHQTYLHKLKEHVRERNLASSVQFFNYMIPEDEIEVFFQAADVAVLPYVEGDFQSGVLFLAYRFGIPVIASDLGSFSQEVNPGVQGYLFETCNAQDLAAKIEQFYAELHDTPNLRQSIRKAAEQYYSWDQTAKRTLTVYQNAHAPYRQA